MTTQVDETRPREVKRKLTAILSADVKGYSRLMGADEEAIALDPEYSRLYMGLAITHIYMDYFANRNKLSIEDDDLINAIFFH